MFLLLAWAGCGRVRGRGRGCERFLVVHVDGVACCALGLALELALGTGSFEIGHC